MQLKQLAGAIRESDVGSRVFASTSHAALGLSTAATYCERLKQPMVYVEYNPQTECYTIEFQQYQGKPDHDVESQDPMTDGTWERIQSWLELTT